MPKTFDRLVIESQRELFDILSELWRKAEHYPHGSTMYADEELEKRIKDALGVSE